MFNNNINYCIGNSINNNDSSKKVINDNIKTNDYKKINKQYYIYINDADLNYIIDNNDFDKFKYYCDNYSYKLNEYLIQKIFIEEKYIFLNLIINKYYPIDDNVLNLCIKFCFKKQINKLLDFGYKWTIYSLSYGNIYGSIDLLDFLIEKGCFWGLICPEHNKIVKKIQK